jgi:hypothetical protein
MRAASILVAFTLTLIAVSAQAQEFVRQDCARLAPPSASLSFDSPEHRLWYRRFWTGDCKDLPILACVPGNPNWNDVITQLLKKGRPDQGPAIRASACRLGEVVGHEWSRAKAVRRINTEDLRSYIAILQATSDVPTGLGRLETRMKTDMAAPPKGR